MRKIWQWVSYFYQAGQSGKDGLRPNQAWRWGTEFVMVTKTSVWGKDSKQDQVLAPNHAFQGMFSSIFAWDFSQVILLSFQHLSPILLYYALCFFHLFFFVFHFLFLFVFLTFWELLFYGIFTILALFIFELFTNNFLFFTFSKVILSKCYSSQRCLFSKVSWLRWFFMAF